MGEYPRFEVDRAMKVEEMMLRAISGELLWLESASNSRFRFLASLSLSRSFIVSIRILLRNKSSRP